MFKLRFFPIILNILFDVIVCGVTVPAHTGSKEILGFPITGEIPLGSPFVITFHLNSR